MGTFILHSHQWKEHSDRKLVFKKKEKKNCYLTNTLYQIELMDIYTIFHPKAPEGTLFSRHMKYSPAQIACYAHIYMLSLPVVSQSCMTLYNPKDCSPPGSSVHGILQARILEWLPFSSPIYMLSIYKFNKIEITLIIFSSQKYETRNQLQKQS